MFLIRTWPRRRRFFAYVRFFLLSFVAVIIFTYYTIGFVRSRIPKMQPTIFPPPMTTPSWTLKQHQGLDFTSLLPPPPERAFRTINEDTLDIDDGRYKFVKPLSSGCEGQARVYLDTKTNKKVVIKTFFGSTRHNPLPDHLLKVFNPREENRWWWDHIWMPLRAIFGGAGGMGANYDTTKQEKANEGAWGRVETWPAEIPSSLWFTKVDEIMAKEHWQAVENSKISTPRRETDRFIHAIDYFYLSNRLVKKNWQLVTPFLEEGTLEDLASVVSFLDLDASQVDSLYRSSFKDLLRSIGDMHKEGYCHDDVKGENIFLSPSTSAWILSDMGSVRHISHIFHLVRDVPPSLTPPSTAYYRSMEKPSSFPVPTQNTLRATARIKNCRYIDLTRAMQTYLAFLRVASERSRAEISFDTHFFFGSASWARVYWAWTRGVIMELDPLNPEPEPGLDPVDILLSLFSIEEARTKPPAPIQNSDSDSADTTATTGAPRPTSDARQTQQRIARMMLEKKRYRESGNNEQSRPAWMHSLPRGQIYMPRRPSVEYRRYGKKKGEKLEDLVTEELMPVPRRGTVDIFWRKFVDGPDERRR